MKNLNWRQAATIGVSVKLRNDYADYDYLDQLNPDEMLWLTAFHREYINADFQHRYPKLHSKKQMKNNYSANNARNRDLYGIAKWTFNLYLFSEITGKYNKKVLGLKQKQGLI